MIEILDVFVQDAPQVGLAHEQDMVQALAAQAAYQPLTDGVRAWRANGGSDQSDPGARRDRVEVRTVFRIIVTEEILRRLTELAT